MSADSKVVTIGSPPWSREEMRASLGEFARLYEKRPIRDNQFGMKSPHLFLTWFVLRKLRPKVVVESGVWMGQGTWCIEQACPDAELYCLDVDLGHVQYRSGRAKYIEQDFTTVDWGHLPKDETVFFFDDHQNALARVKAAAASGFKHLIFEDNYVPQHADCYSLKMAFMHTGLRRPAGKGWFKRLVKLLNGDSNWAVPPNSADEDYLRRTLQVYQELPPVFKEDRTRWNTPWNEMDYPTPEPLLQEVRTDFEKVYFDEAPHYTWLCYAKLY